MTAPAEPDPELDLKAAVAAARIPQPDMGRITTLLQEMQRQIASLDALTLGATRANCLDTALSHAAYAVMAAEAANLCLLSLTRELGTLRSTAQAAEVRVRQAIGAAMQGTGCLVFPLEHHTIEAAAGAERVEVPEPGKLPEQFWRHVEPEPDKARIAAALRFGPVPGARHARGLPTIRIKQRKGLSE